MSYGQNLIQGVHAGLAMNKANAPKRVSTRIVGPPPGMSFGLQSKPEESSAAFQERQMAINRQMESDHQAKVAAESRRLKQEQAEKQAIDYDNAMVRFIGLDDPRALLNYVNDYGSKDANLSDIRMNQDGSVTVVETPQGPGHAEINGMVYGGQKQPEPAREHTFKDKKEAYSQFFGKLRAPAGATYEAPQSPKQEWVFGADGELRMDKFSGQTEKTGYVKPEKGGADGSGGGVKAHLYDEFNQALLRSMIAEYGIEEGDFVIDDLGNQRVDINRYVDKLPSEAKQRYLKALNEGERLMVDESLSPIRAAQQALGPADAMAVTDPEILKKAEEIAQREARNKASWFSSDSDDFKESGGTREGFIAERTQYWARRLSGQEGEPPKGEGSVFSRLPGGDQAEASAAKVIKALSAIPEEEARTEQVKRFLASDAPSDVKEQVRYQYESQHARAKAGEAREARETKYWEKQKHEMNPEKVKAGIFTGMNRAMEQNGIDPNWQLNLVGKGLSVIWKISPVRMLGAESVAVLKKFQDWAMHRYDRPDAAQDPQVLAEYAKVDPEAAQAIADEAVKVAQAGNSVGMAR